MHHVGRFDSDRLPPKVDLRKYTIEDAGRQMELAIKALTEYGACCEDIWPNDEDLIFQEPESSAYEHAANFKIEEAEFIETDLDLWKHTLVIL